MKHAVEATSVKWKPSHANNPTPSLSFNTPAHPGVWGRLWHLHQPTLDGERAAANGLALAEHPEHGIGGSGILRTERV
jgi:hypothetical protein